MPAAPQDPAARNAPFTRPPNTSSVQDHHAHAVARSVSIQPAPAVVEKHSHASLHTLPRRFLGPMPENVVNSTDQVEKQRHFRNMRRRAVQRWTGREAEEARGRLRRIDASFGLDDGRRGVSRALHRIRAGRAGELDHLDLDDSDDEAGPSNKHGKKHKRKDVWIGDSFDIGQEFRTVDPPERTAADATSVPQRPPNSTQTTQESFYTARTEFSDAVEPSDPGRSPDTLRNGVDPEVRQSQSSSMQPLLPDVLAAEDLGSSLAGSPTSPVRSTHKLLKPKKSALGIKSLKSALRRPSGAPNGNSRPATTTDIDATSGKAKSMIRRGRAKSVQFPMDPVQVLSSTPAEGRGDEEPADPQEVLSRRGEDAEGTSHGAVEEAIGEDEVDDEDFVPVGEVIMRDRVIVRVAYHREEGIALFDEDVQRRNPVARFEHFEEYIMALRKGRLEFYQDWTNPLKERIRKVKRLCFAVPLLPIQTSLGVFNNTDMTLSICTSVSRLTRDVERLMHTATSRGRQFRSRVAESKQVQWLKNRRTGTHIFVIKVRERSRALDWYWEIWRELGGELPSRVDIAMPSLSTSVRLVIPEDEDMGGRMTRKLLNPKSAIHTCFDMMSGVVDLEGLTGSNTEQDVALELAWKTGDGYLDWLAWRTNVVGKKRDWGVLAGIARTQASPTTQHLQLRRSRHQPACIKLEDGTSLNEPSGVEGFLTRHKSAASPKSDLYVSTHEGNIFATHPSDGHPPVKPLKMGSTPSDLFPELYQAFVQHEHDRMSRFIARSIGCVDLRDVQEIKLCSEHEDASQIDEEAQDNKKRGKRSERTFQVLLRSGQVVRFEAYSPDVAKEWVEQLRALAAFWKRRHRVDARARGDAMAASSRVDPFAGMRMGNDSDHVLADVWDWCVLQGCRSVTMAGRLYMAKGGFDKYRARYIVLAGGWLTPFKIKSKADFHPRKKRYALFGAYTYSGMLAVEEIRGEERAGPFDVPNARIYQDGLQSSDGEEDSTFCVRLAAAPSTWSKRRPQPYELGEDTDAPHLPLTKKPPLVLNFRARSKLERDRWIWAINAEMERQARAHVKHEEAHRHYGSIPVK